jgi:alkaline phosphatase D
MKKIFFMLCLAFSQLMLNAESIPDSIKNPLLAPFYYGVLSGDPLSDRVIIWTHVAAAQPGTASVEWQMATDTFFSNIVASGTAVTDETKDYTVKVDIEGLQPNQWYYYRFSYNNISSIIGRTRTLPTANVDQLRFAVMTCADYKDGYFNAYDRLVARNDLDAVIHLGDYIYETKGDEGNLRIPLPKLKCKTVEDFRTRYAFYRLDPQVAAAHQQYPWFCVWDDHEFRNDAWRDGAVDLTGQDWLDVKAAGLHVYHEWMPIRVPDASDSLRIYRSFSLGPLADLIMLDARIIGRDEPLALDDPNLNDSMRTVLGHTQRDWFKNELSASTAKWKLVAQQILMAPYSIFGGPFPGTEKVWNGFPFEREHIFNYINDNNINNTVILTGDVHAGFANDLPLNIATYDSSTGAGSVAVEFVIPSVTSGGSTQLPFQVIKDNNPFTMYADLTIRGYLVIDVKQDTVYGNFYSTPHLNYSEDETFIGNYYTVAGTSHLQKATFASEKILPKIALAPAAPRIPLYSRNEIPVNNAFRIYPNPSASMINIELMLPEFVQHNATLEIFDGLGKTMHTETVTQGIFYSSIAVENYPKGIYFVRISGNNYSKALKFIKE